MLLSLAGEIGLQADKRRIQAQLKTGYRIITLQDKNSGHQADFILHTRGKLERRPGSLLGLGTYYQTPESLILAKLRMVKATRPRERSLKDRDDIRAIISNTKVDKRKILRIARRETTLTIFQETLSTTLSEVKAGRRKWGKEAFPDAGEATFGD